MIAKIIELSIKHRTLVLILTFLISSAGFYASKNIPVDALPDLSDVQVIVKTSYPGQAPDIVESQITYPLSSALLAVPKAKTVRGYSFFGDSYIYVLFDEGTDLYWARSRVIEYLNQAQQQLPDEAKPSLGPDASGVGWIYIYALKDTSGNHDLAQLTSLQDWYLKYELQSLPGVAEIATAGGMRKEYQIKINPNTLLSYQLTLSDVTKAIQSANSETGASVLEMAEAEYMIRSSAYLSTLDDFKNIPIQVRTHQHSNNDETLSVISLGDIAQIELGPAMRRGITELDGEGETVGGIVVMRSGENAQTTIDAVKQKLQELAPNLPDGVEIVTSYDRSRLIHNAIEHLKEKLLEELLLVALICALFLLHFRSALIAMITLPLGILTAFILMYWQGINANIMSLAGIAIAIGAMTDGAMVLIENFHKHASENEDKNTDHWQLVKQSSIEVGPSLFFSLLIITVSFIPVFTLQAQEGKLFTPLAYTKTYAMAASAIIAITVIPVLIGYFIKGKIKSESENPVNRWLIYIYQPILNALLIKPWLTIALASALLASVTFPLKEIGSEFMPPLDEGDLMYMPSTYPAISIGKAQELLQQTDKLIKQHPEVERVFGKIGRADTATDPAPLTMIETFIQLKPKQQWRPGITLDKIKAELDQQISIPGISNAWVMPIKTRIDMLATGIKTPIGIKLSGNDLKELESLGKQIEQTLSKLPSTASAYAERSHGGRYINIEINRDKVRHLGISINEIQSVISTGIGGKVIDQTVEGLERYNIKLRFQARHRQDVEQLKELRFFSSKGHQLKLSDVAAIQIEDGPAMIKSENARQSAWVLVDIHTQGKHTINIAHYIDQAKALINKEIHLPTGVSLSWSGQYEYMQRAKAQLQWVVPLTLCLIIILLYLNFQNLKDVLLILVSLPFALIGSIWTLYLLQFNFSVAVAVGFIALAGVAAETAIIMLQYLKGIPRHTISKSEVLAIASRRVRPVLITAIATIAGLLPIMLSDGTGSEVMSRIAAPMLGGMISTIVLTLLVLPCIFYLSYRNKDVKQ